MTLYKDIVDALNHDSSTHTELHKYITDLYCVKQAELRRLYGSEFKGNHFTLMGNLVHTGIQKTVEGYKSEIPLTIGDLHGRADLTKDDTLYEIKYSPFGSEKNKEYYLLQASMYAHELGLSNVELLIISSVGHYTVKLGNVLVEKYNNKAMDIFKDNTYPVMEVKCKYCEYKGVHCFR